MSSTIPKIPWASKVIQYSAAIADPHQQAALPASIMDANFLVSALKLIDDNVGDFAKAAVTKRPSLHLSNTSTLGYL